MNEEQNISDGLQMENDSGEQPEAMAPIGTSQSGGQLPTESEISNPKPEIKNMEVHHHPHVEKKSFKEYLLEGLMIFVAVSMGFIAENIREHFIEKETEKRNIKLIVDNLKEDTASLERSIKMNIKNATSTDTLLLFRDKDLKDTIIFKKFVSAYNAVGNAYWFHSNNSGLEQMKSSGTIRLVKKKQVLDSLYKYEKLNYIIEGNSTFASSSFLKAFDFATTFISMDKDYTKAKPFNIEQKADAINQFYNYTVAANANLSLLYVPQLKKQKQRATNLIKLLQTEYHLEHE